ncbi:MAG: hypothetical protein ACLUOI_13735 [Eisenbergiella sp.]
MTQRNRNRKKTRALFRRVLAKALSVQEELKVSEWAERYRVLDESSNLSGKWSNSVTPYLIELWMLSAVRISGKFICVKGLSLEEQKR